MAATSPSSVGEHQPQPGLRERKKIKTRIAIRRATCRLIAEQGYDATTVEQIAAAAEVSPSTVFRYFPTKEDIVLSDEHSPAMAAMLRSRPAGESALESLRLLMVQSLRTVPAGECGETVQRAKLMVEIPAVRARMTESLSVTAGMLTEVLAERTGRDPGELELRVFTAAVLSALREITLYWGERGCQGDPLALVNRALATLETLSSGPRLQDTSPE
ncbi:TetR/AcrR family transcriptional regulator [Streptomyces sp. AK02-01A]|uniref:TetR/AcrR family transcriptional regulator n=1 Tax=Streptomyces sp. AK02-01A TaxID=3028648 RepID=UPI0029B332BA|nr:TetR family transcriptional regulator [Streptomyces sp. AK02-01A]MDX3851707.1 TetR family transcriptional regulator [Streptomyces sp. AK02-01A]